jgi:ubiquinone biosynthesis protein
LPELPRLVHDFLKHGQNNDNAQLQLLIKEQRRTNRLLQGIAWVGGGFVLGMLAMQIFVRLHHFY